MRVRRVVADLPAADPRASAAFYGALCGLEVAMDLGWVLTLADAVNDTAQLTLVRTTAPGSEEPEISIEVDDVDAAYAAAERLGAEIVRPLTDEPWGVRRFFVRDPDGHVVNVVSHR